MNDLKLERAQGVATITIDRPEKHNALTATMWRSLATLVSNLSKDNSVAVLLVRGSGMHFSAGADIGEFHAVRMNPEAGRKYDEDVAHAERALTHFPRPTIAIIRGWCIGGGCEIALACDLRLAADDATFAITPAKVGLVYSLMGVQRLVDTVGPAHAKQILFTAEQFHAYDALRIGLVNEVHPVSQLETRVDQIARAVASGANNSIAASKLMVEHVLSHRAALETDTTRALVDNAYASPELAEGVAAFAEKRRPNFRDRPE